MTYNMSLKVSDKSPHVRFVKPTQYYMTDVQVHCCLLFIFRLLPPSRELVVLSPRQTWASWQYNCWTVN